MKHKNKKTLTSAIITIVGAIFLGWLFHVLPPVGLNILAGILTAVLLGSILLFTGLWGSIKKLWKRIWK